MRGVDGETSERVREIILSVEMIAEMSPCLLVALASYLSAIIAALQKK